MKATYEWSTDAASGTIEADDIDAVVKQLIAENEWAELDSPRERRDIADSAFLIIRGPQDLVRGKP